MVDAPSTREMPPGDPPSRPTGATAQAPARRQDAAAAAARRLGRGLRRWSRRLARSPLPRAAGVAAVVLAGAALGAALAPATTANVGPLQAEVRVVPSLDPGVRLLLPPAGQVEFDTHRAPVAVEAQISQVDLEGARALIDSPAGLRELGDTAPELLRAAALRATLVSAACCLAGALVLSALVYRRRWRRTVQVAGGMVVLLVATGAGAAATVDADRFTQPRFTGLLSQAPYIAGQVPSVLARLESYRSGLSDLVQSVTSLYATAGQLPDDVAAGADTTTVLHVSDIHLNPLAFDLIDKLVPQFGVDVVVDTGDITTWGTGVESAALSRIGQVPVPYVFVRGNHDSAATEVAVAGNENAVVLDGQVAQVGGLVIAGIGDPVFTPDGDEEVPRVTATPRAATATPGGAAQTPDGGSTPSEELQRAANQRLADAIAAWTARNPSRPVQIAAVHEPRGLEPLLGRVPLLLAGHLHSRDAEVDATGTRVLVEGSTGGAGITARGLDRLSEGDPLPLAASLVHIAGSGPRAGQVVAVDAITVGGFGLSSVSLERTVVLPEDVPALDPDPDDDVEPTPTGSPGPSR